MKYEEYIQSDLWREQREKVIEKFGGKCALCGKKYIKNLHIHHRTYQYPYGSDGELKNLTLLCASCHDDFHKSKEYCQSTHCFEKKKASISIKPVKKRFYRTKKRKNGKKSNHGYKNITIIPRSRMVGCLIDIRGKGRIKKKFSSSEEFMDKFEAYQFFCKNFKRKPRSNDISVTPDQLGVLTYFVRRLCLK